MAKRVAKKKTPKPIRKVKSEWNEVWIDTTFHTKNNVYHISNYGRIRSTQKRTGDEVLIKGSMTSRHLALNVIQPDGSRGICTVPRFVAEHFVDKPSEEHTRIIHIDGDYTNNKWINLKWVTLAEWYEYNQKSKEYLEGRKKLQKYTYKLNETKVRLIKKRLKTGKVKARTLAKQFNVSPHAIWNIKSGKRWAHVKIDDE